jgi:diguanylate cyclase (GGDEF)-like protein
MQGVNLMQPDRRFVWRAESQERSTEAKSAAASRRKPVRHPCRVLVVDDDVLVRAQLCALLHGSDYDVETATSGEDALRLLRSYPCDIVVTDWQMPLMDGVTLCRQVRSMKQHEHIYMLMLTVKRAPQELLAGLAAGADDYVIKGTSSEELLARVEKGRVLAHWKATHRSNAGDSSLTDIATGAYNLSYLMEHLPREIARAERHGRSLSVLNCGIDEMVLVNEQLIGVSGDASMREFVSSSMACIRRGDWLVRTGESEFIIVLPETDGSGAQCVVRKLGEAFACRKSAPSKEPFGGAVNIYVTAMHPNADGEGAANMRALLNKVESLRHRDKRDAKRPAKGEMHYLSDFVADGDLVGERNWPAA